jgi:uncharacterized cupredoxin-like copper-binding protein
MSSIWTVLARGIGACALALFLAACGQGEETQPDDGTETTASTADTIEITMTDYAYQPSDVTVPAGQEVTLQFTNAGSVEHYFVVGDTIDTDQDGFEQNLFSGVSITKTKQAEGHGDEEHEDEEHEDEEHEEDEAHHENEFELPPGGSGAMTFTLPASKVGTYTIACFETTGGQKHHEMGMEGTLTVTASEGE